VTTTSTVLRGLERRAEPLVLGLVLAVLAHGRVAVWLGKGEGVEAMEPLWRRWALGLAIAAGLGTVLTMLMPPESRAAQWLRAQWLRAARASDGRAFAVTLATCCVVGYALVGRAVFAGRPLLIDEIVQMLQARIFQEGRLWRPVAAEPAFESLMLVVDVAGKWFGQFPPGWSVLLVPFDALGVSWLAAPVLGALAVLAFAAWQRAAEPDAATRFGGLLLFATAPFFVFLAASHMNHVPMLACVLLGAAATARVAAGAGVRPALLAGAGFGVAATIRPFDALAWCAPAGLWLLGSTWRDARRRWLLGWFCVAAGVPVLAFFWYNAQTTGHPLLFGYEQLWGPSHRLGFHDAPWGPPHTPARGLTLVHGAFVRLQTYGFEGLVPAVSAAVLGLVLWPRFSAADRYLAATAVLTTFFYFLYWHDGFFLGPRLYLGVWPFVVTWVARVPQAIARRWPTHPRLATGAAWALVVSPVVGWPSNLPFRLSQYSSGLLSMRWDPDVEAARAGATGGLVFVREPWGARSIARLWSLGAPRVDTEALYRKVDLCKLELRTDSLAALGMRGHALVQRLESLMADSSLLVRAPFGVDETARVQLGAAYPPRCLREVLEDAEGTTVLAPRLLARDGTRYVRSMGPMDTLLLAAEPGRPAFILRADTTIGARPVYVPLNRDSVWRTARSPGLR
jgi:hypothetical protein